MAHMGNVAQPAPGGEHPGGERVSSESGTPTTVARVQLPRDLLRSRSHSGLAVWVWATYETLMPRALGGGRAPAYARRVWLANKAGVGTRAIDDARRELLAEGDGGPWLRRSRIQGCKRASRHVALRLPRETGEPYVDVPAWTMDLVHAGRRRPEGTISPDAWRLYLRALDKARVQQGAATERPFETTLAKMGGTLMGGASASTARRRLRELETVGLVEVAERPGGSLVITVHTTPEAAAEAARRYAEHGRKTLAPRTDPFQRTPLTPANELHSPLPPRSSPLKTPPDELKPEKTMETPAVGEKVQGDARARETAHAGATQTSRFWRPSRQARHGASKDAIRLLRHHLPRQLLAHVPEHGLRRVLRALDEELQHRDVTMLAARIQRRWEAWRWRPEEIQDHTAVAITIVRRGYSCPDVRCEMHVNIDSGRPCQWCEQNRSCDDQPDASDGGSEALSGSQSAELTLAAGSPRVAVPPPVSEVVRLSPKDADTYARYAPLARRLLHARTDAEREAILTECSKINKAT